MLGLVFAELLQIVQGTRGLWLAIVVAYMAAECWANSGLLQLETDDWATLSRSSRSSQPLFRPSVLGFRA